MGSLIIIDCDFVNPFKFFPAFTLWQCYYVSILLSFPYLFTGCVFYNAIVDNAISQVGVKLEKVFCQVVFELKLKPENPDAIVQPEWA